MQSYDRQRTGGGLHEQRFSGHHGPTSMMKVNVRLVNKDLLLPDFPCMPSELASKFVEKMCNQFTLNKESVRVLTNGKLLQFNQANVTLKDAGVVEGSVLCLLGGCLTAEFQKEAYPTGYNRALAPGQATNMIGSRLGALRAMHRQGVTKVKIPTRQEQAKLEYLKVEMRGEEQKADPSIGSEPATSTPQKQGYFARFLPKLPTFGASPKPSSKGKKGDLISPQKRGTPAEGLVKALEQHQVHKFQKKDQDLKSDTNGPSPEQIAIATDAHKVLRSESDSGRRRRGDPEELFGENSALLDILRQDERLSNLFQGIGRGRPIASASSSSSNAAGSESRAANRSGGSQSEQANALAHALFGQLMGSAQRRGGAPVVVNEEHLRSMVEMGFEERRCRRALRYFSNDLDSSIQHVCSTTDAQDDSILGPEPPQEQPRQSQQVAQQPPALRSQSMQQMAASSSSSSRPQAERIRIVQPASQMRAPQVVAVEEFKADPDSLSMLLEMGYPRDDSLIALKVTSNNLEQACTFLMNNPNPAQSLGYQIHMQQRQEPARQVVAQEQSSSQSMGVANNGEGQQRLGQYATRLAAQTSQRAQALFEDVSRLEAAMNQLVQQSNTLNIEGPGQGEQSEADGNAQGEQQQMMQQPPSQMMPNQPAQGQQPPQAHQMQYMNHHFQDDSDELDLDEADYYDQLDDYDDLQDQQ